MSRYIDAEIFERNMQNEWERNEISNGDWIHFREMINDEPTADVQPVVRGEWIPIGEVDKDNNQQVECSHCHAGDLHAVGVEVPYCWRCGARMVEE